MQSEKEIANELQDNLIENLKEFNVFMNAVMIKKNNFNLLKNYAFIVGMEKVIHDSRMMFLEDVIKSKPDINIEDFDETAEALVKSVYSGMFSVHFDKLRK